MIRACAVILREKANPKATAGSHRGEAAESETATSRMFKALTICRGRRKPIECGHRAIALCFWMVLVMGAGLYSPARVHAQQSGASHNSNTAAKGSWRFVVTGD